VQDGTTDVSGYGSTSYKFYTDVGATTEISAPIDAGTYYVKAFFTSDGLSHAGKIYTNVESAVGSFSIAKADATLHIGNYSDTYDSQYHGLSGTATGVVNEDLSSLLTLGSTYRNVGSYTVSWSFAGNNNYNSATGSGTVDILVRHITGSFTVANKTYDGTTTATVTGTDLDNEVSGDDVNLVVVSPVFSSKNAGTWSVTGSYSLSGNDVGNYVLDSVTPASATIYARALDSFATGSTQAALDLSKQGTLSFAINLSGGIVDGQSVAQLFNGATFTLSMANGSGGWESITVTATATVVDNVVYVNINLKGNTSFYNFLAQGLDAGETSASRANWETIRLSGFSNDGNYSLTEDFMTRIFKSTK
jgi:hypothetical protein